MHTYVQYIYFVPLGDGNESLYSQLIDRLSADLSVTGIGVRSSSHELTTGAGREGSSLGGSEDLLRSSDTDEGLLSEDVTPGLLAANLRALEERVTATSAVTQPLSSNRCVT